MTPIEQARAILADVRKWTTARRGVAVPVSAHPADAALITLMTSPKMLDAIDAIDGILAVIEREPDDTRYLWPELWTEVEQVASAIIEWKAAQGDRDATR